MMKSLTTSDRVMLLLALIPFLVERGPTPLSELAESFGVDERMLGRLVPFLGMAGVPGETGTYQHEDLFDLDWEAFEAHGVVSLTRVVAVDDTPRFSHAETAALLAGLHALLPLLPESERADAHSAAVKLGAAEAWNAEAPDAPRAPSFSVTPDPANTRLTQLTRAIDSGQRVTFVYRDHHGTESSRRVEPLLLARESGSWYLRAYCLDREAERTFAVDRMSSVVPLDEGAARRHAGRAGRIAFDLPAAALTATVLLRESAIHRIAGFAPEVLGEANDGWLRARVELAHTCVAVRLVQAAPGELIIESPAEARDAVAAWAERALSRYDE